MESMKHTPGPWTLKGRSTVMAEARQVAWCGFKMGDWPAADYEEEGANARLIAAAPDLLEALRAMLKTHDPFETTDEMEDARDDARAAIARAEGR